MDKVIESHWIFKSSKSMKPAWEISSEGPGVKRWLFLWWLYVVTDLPVCPDNTISGFWVESLLGYTVLIAVAQHLYGLVDTFVLYTEHETL